MMVIVRCWCCCWVLVLLVLVVVLMTSRALSFYFLNFFDLTYHLSKIFVSSLCIHNAMEMESYFFEARLNKFLLLPNLLNFFFELLNYFRVLIS